jgi:hypothetical protein
VFKKHTQYADDRRNYSCEKVLRTGRMSEQPDMSGRPPRGTADGSGFAVRTNRQRGPGGMAPDGDGRERSRSNPGAAAAPGKARPRGKRQVNQVAFDPGFRAAVSLGLLTAAEASRRGKRSAYIARLVAFEELPLFLAIQVTDGSITVEEARSRARAGEAAAAAADRAALPARRRHLRITVALVCGSLFLFSALGTMLIRPARALRSGQSPVPAAVGPGGTEGAVPPDAVPRCSTRTVAGAVVAIEGPDPRSVLEAFRDSRPPGRRVTPVGIAPTLPADPGLRMGLFRNLVGNNGDLLAIAMRRDARTWRWFAGDGNKPVPIVAVPEYAGRSDIIPVP